MLSNEDFVENFYQSLTIRTAKSPKKEIENIAKQLGEILYSFQTLADFRGVIAENNNEENEEDHD